MPVSWPQDQNEKKLLPSSWSCVCLCNTLCVGSCREKRRKNINGKFHPNSADFCFKTFFFHHNFLLDSLLSRQHLLPQWGTICCMDGKWVCPFWGWARKSLNTKNFVNSCGWENSIDIHRSLFCHWNQSSKSWIFKFKSSLKITWLAHPPHQYRWQIYRKNVWKSEYFFIFRWWFFARVVVWSFIKTNCWLPEGRRASVLVVVDTRAGVDEQFFFCALLFPPTLIRCLQLKSFSWIFMAREAETKRKVHECMRKSDSKLLCKHRHKWLPAAPRLLGCAEPHSFIWGFLHGV